ncbi:MAG: hypothetical protein U9R15_01500 [Chloroflexota bacterium]|nr:hypothetical protein [Chloroflexota bacterium]
MTKETKTEEKESKSADDMLTEANTIINFIKHERFTVEEAICVLALASSLLQTELIMKTFLKDAQVVKMPMQPPNTMIQKPDSN